MEFKIPYKGKAKTLKHFEKQLTDKYHLRGYKHNTNLSIEKFIENFINKYRNIYNTYNKNSIQCGIGRRRSLGDIYQIIKYYYPNISLLEVKNILTNLCVNNKINTNVCYDINKRVYFTNSMNLGILRSEFKDEFGMNWNDLVNCKK